MRRWTIKDKDGRLLVDIYLERTRRNVERRLVPEYIGAESEWSWGYRKLCDAELSDRLERDGLKVVEIEMSATEVER